MSSASISCMRSLTLSMLAFFLCTCESHDEKNPVQVRLVANRNAIVRGEPLRLAYVFDIAAPWHIYSSEPAAGTRPTTISTLLPAGISAGPLQWPKPETFTLPGEIKLRGYATALTVQQVLETPRGLAGQNVTVQGAVEWLACSDICIPGRANLALQLEIHEASRAINEEIFRAQ